MLHCRQWGRKAVAIGAIAFLSCFILPFALPLGDTSFIVFGVCAVVGFFFITAGFFLGKPILMKSTLKYAKHVTNYSKQEMTELNEMVTDTQLSSIEKITKTARKGWEQGQSETNETKKTQKYCMNCGEGLPMDAKFCGNCGEKQN